MPQSLPQRGYGVSPTEIVLRGFGIGLAPVIPPLADIVTRGFGQSPKIVTRGYFLGAEPPPDPPTPVTPTGTQYGADAGPGFGKWFNLAYNTSSSGKRRSRDTDLGRMLDELVYRDEDAVALAAMPVEDAREAREVVQEASRLIETTVADDQTSARAVVAEQMATYQRLLNVRAAEAQRLFIVALAQEARRQWDEAIARRIAQDDADLLILAPFLL